MSAIQDSFRQSKFPQLNNSKIPPYVQTLTSDSLYSCYRDIIHTLTILPFDHVDLAGRVARHIQSTLGIESNSYRAEAFLLRLVCRSSASTHILDAQNRNRRRLAGCRMSWLAVSTKGNGEEFVSISMLLIPISMLMLLKISTAAEGLTSCRAQSCMPHLRGC